MATLRKNQVVVNGDLTLNPVRIDARRIVLSANRHQTGVTTRCGGIHAQ